MVAALLLQVVKSYAAQTAARGSAILTVDALNMMLMAGLVLLILRQIMPIAASVAGGAALSSFGVLSRTVALSRGPADRAVRFAAPIIADSTTRVARAGSRAGQAAYRRASESIHALRDGWRRPRP
jgi:type IV secretion system protein VirB6